MPWGVNWKAKDINLPGMEPHKDTDSDLLYLLCYTGLHSNYLLNEPRATAQRQPTAVKQLPPRQPGLRGEGLQPLRFPQRLHSLLKCSHVCLSSKMQTT